MKRSLPFALLLLLTVNSCDTDNSGDCPVTATVQGIGLDCQYYYFKTSSGEFLYPDQGLVQEIDDLNTDISLLIGTNVQLGYREKDLHEYTCLALLVGGRSIDITCLSVADEAVDLE